MVAVDVTNFTLHMLYCLVVLYLLPDKQLLKSFSEVKEGWRGGWGSQRSGDTTPCRMTGVTLQSHVPSARGDDGPGRLGCAAHGGMVDGVMLVCWLAFLAIGIPCVPEDVLSLFSKWCVLATVGLYVSHTYTVCVNSSSWQNELVSI